MSALEMFPTVQPQSWPIVTHHDINGRTYRVYQFPSGCVAVTTAPGPTCRRRYGPTPEAALASVAASFERPGGGLGNQQEPAGVIQP